MHGSATTTPAIRRAIQTSPASIRNLAAKYGINPKTVVKWKSRPFQSELPMGPGKNRVRSLSREEEGTCIGFRIQTLLPLDDCLYALQLIIPQLTRSGLHRLYQRHGISRLPDIPNSTMVNNYPGDARIGSFFVNAADIRTGDGRATMFFAFDRTSKFAFAKLYERADPSNGPAFLNTLVAGIPYSIETILTGEHPIFTARRTPNPRSFADTCRRHRIRHEILPLDQPWQIRRAYNGSVDNRRSADKAFHYQSHAHLQEHFLTFFDTYNFERRLKTLRGLTPYEFVCQSWREYPDRFRKNPIKNRPGLKI